MIRWLTAQAQPTESERTRHLLAILGELDPADPYAQLARAALDAEAPYIPAEKPRRTGLWIGGGVLLLVLIIGGGLLLMRPRGAVSAPTVTAAAAAPSPSPTTPPDQSRPLVANSFVARYEAGILQVTAVEDRSLRVVDARTGEPLQPVAGARFYALALDFECRSGICSSPPQAALALRTENEAALPLREGAAIAGAPGLEPIALGRSTRGWVVFELPSLSRVEALLVTPIGAEPEAEPLVIDMPDVGL